MSGSCTQTEVPSKCPNRGRSRHLLSQAPGAAQKHVSPPSTQRSWWKPPPLISLAWRFGERRRTQSPHPSFCKPSTFPTCTGHSRSPRREPRPLAFWPARAHWHTPPCVLSQPATGLGNCGSRGSAKHGNYSREITCALLPRYAGARSPPLALPPFTHRSPCAGGARAGPWRPRSQAAAGVTGEGDALTRMT